MMVYNNVAFLCHRPGCVAYSSPWPLGRSLSSHHHPASQPPAAGVTDESLWPYETLATLSCSKASTIVNINHETGMCRVDPITWYV